jgi:colicin import membrane protein
MSAVLHWGERHDVAYGRSFALAFAIHLVLLAVLFLGVRLQSHAPESVTVELWEPPPPPRVEEPPAPVPPKVEPEPPKPEPKIEKPEIVEKPAPKPKPEPKVPPKPKPAPKLEPKRDVEMERRMRDQLAQEQTASQQRQMRDQAAREQAALRARGLNEYIGRIQAKVKSNWILPPDLTGNPEAIFSVVQIPTGEVIAVKLAKSSGIPAYDAAVERAILKSSPLPLPASREDFSRELKLTFRPLDK